MLFYERKDSMLGFQNNKSNSKANIEKLSKKVIN